MGGGYSRLHAFLDSPRPIFASLWGGGQGRKTNPADPRLARGCLGMRLRESGQPPHVVQIQGNRPGSICALTPTPPLLRGWGYHTYIHTFIHTYTHTHIHTYIRTHTYIHTHTYMHIPLWLHYVCTYVCVYIYICVCVRIAPGVVGSPR